MQERKRHSCRPVLLLLHTDSSCKLTKLFVTLVGYSGRLFWYVILVTGKSQTCAATAAQVVLRPFQKASSLEGGFSPLQLHVGDVPLEEQQVHLLMHTTANRSVCKNRLYQWGGSKGG